MLIATRWGWHMPCYPSLHALVPQRGVPGPKAVTDLDHSVTCVAARLSRAARDAAIQEAPFDDLSLVRSPRVAYAMQ